MKLYMFVLMFSVFATSITSAIAQQVAPPTIATKASAGTSSNDSDFDALYRLLKTQYTSKDYKIALETLDALKAAISAKVQDRDNSALITPNVSEDFNTLYAKATPHYTLNFGDDVLKVFANKDVFISGDSENNHGESLRYRDIFIGKISVQFNDEDLVDDVYCKINGKTEMIHYSVSNSKVLTVSNHGDKEALNTGGINLNSAGDCIVTLALAGKTLRLPIRVSKLPVYGGMPKDDFIKIMGLPDDKRTDKVDWPGKKFIDGVFYEPSAAVGTEYTEHWFYKKYPRIVFVVDGTGTVLQVHDTGW